MCKFVGVGNILHIARKCLAGNKSAALMCKALRVHIELHFGTKTLHEVLPVV